MPVLVLVMLVVLVLHMVVFAVWLLDFEFSCVQAREQMLFVQSVGSL